MRQDIRGRAALRNLAFRHHHDHRAEGQRFVHVMRDEHDGFAGVAMQPRELLLQGSARHRIERAERLVHQDEIGICGKGAGNADTLLLTAGELMRKAVEQGRSISAMSASSFTRAAIRALIPAQEPRHGGDIVAHAPMRKQTAGLNDVADAASQLFRREITDRSAADARSCLRPERSAH